MTKTFAKEFNDMNTFHSFGSLLGVVLTLSAIVTLVPPTNAQDADAHPPARRLTVTGQGEARIAPDKADISLGVVTQNKSSQAASKANAAASQAVLESIRKLGIADKDIQTINYSVQPIMTGFDGKTKPTIIGYEVSNIVRITVRDLSRISDVMDAGTTAGANNVQGISFGREDMQALQDAAMDRAVADARHKADRLARAAGVSIIGVYEVNENGNSRPMPLFMAKNEANADAASTPIQPGELTATVNVTIVYEINSGAKVGQNKRTGPVVASHGKIGLNVRAARQ